MALQFILCELYKDLVQGIKVNINKIIAANKLDARLSFSSNKPMEILHYSSKKIEFPNINAYMLCLNQDNYEKALRVAKLIRNNDPNCYLIFVSNSDRLAYEIIKSNVEVFDYYLAPVKYEDLEKSFIALYKSYKSYLLSNNDENSIYIKSGNSSYKLAFSEIIYVDSSEQKLKFHTFDKSIECFGYLKDTIKILNKSSLSFYRCHRSYIININYIKEINYTDMTIEMTNGDICYLSRQKKREIKEFLQNHK